MPVIIKPKRTSTSGATPTGLASGEIFFNIADKKSFIYNGTQAVQTGAGTLAALGDVAVSSLAANQKLVYNGTSWVNTTDQISATFSLPAYNLAAHTSDESTITTINTSSMGTIINATVSLTLVGDDFNFTTKTGTILNDAFNLVGYSSQAGSGNGGFTYPLFDTQFINNNLRLIYHQFRSGSYGYAATYFMSNSSNWDGTSQSRGWITIYATKL